ncbi:thioredoxin-disulfide reductase [Desulfotomaculum copahuensis]|uniref:Thioredoxin reductase n=1 Tax=Desulfotomaculum copahuensis TaxID=1838280 RepID=A0A1B7LFT7_9FIRM|nr:thioredoxin-disulfide reductase [Desulfotomaculum copahuensis]OAT83508.1 thioredoxin-disulfide reductase [Desulfotomaculum copahuensis]
MKDVIIIGGGPAGLSAGIYAARADMQALLIERAMTGGLAASTERIENYPGYPEGIGGPELMSKMDEQARHFGLEVTNTAVEEIRKEDNLFTIKTEDGELQAKTVILATGAYPRLLNVKGEQELLGRGISFCATCDGAFFRNRSVAVIGGGDAAVEEAMFLTRFASRVYIVHRRDQLRATKIVQQRAFKNDKIEFVWNSVVDQVIGEDKVAGVLLKNVQTGDTRRLDVDGVFIYVGYQPNSKLVSSLAGLDERGYVITGEDMATSCPGLFAAGDVRRKSLRQVVTAVADGAVAAVSAEKFIAQG